MNKDTHIIVDEICSTLIKIGLICHFDDYYDNHIEVIICNPHWLNNQEIYDVLFNFMKENDFIPVKYYQVNPKTYKKFDDIKFREFIGYKIPQVTIRFERK